MSKTTTLIKRKRALEPITTLTCCYCLHYHIKMKILKRGCRLCAKGEAVNSRTGMCGAFEFKKYYFCADKKKKVSSLECQINRMAGIPHCLECGVFEGPPKHVVESAKHLKPKLIRRKQ